MVTDLNKLFCGYGVFLTYKVNNSVRFGSAID